MLFECFLGSLCDLRAVWETKKFKSVLLFLLSYSHTPVSNVVTVFALRNDFDSADVASSLHTHLQTFHFLILSSDSLGYCHGMFHKYVLYKILSTSS